MLQPRDLTLMVGVHQLCLPPLAIRSPDPQYQTPTRLQLVCAQNIQPIINVDPIILRRIRKRKRKHSLLLQICLMNPRKTARDNRYAAQESRLERSVLATRSFAVVPVADDAPSDAGASIIFCDFRNSGDSVGDKDESFAADGLGADGALCAG
jgi:hypothetical protein